MLPENVQKYREKYQKKQLKDLKIVPLWRRKRDGIVQVTRPPPSILVVRLIDFKDIHALLILQKIKN